MLATHEYAEAGLFAEHRGAVSSNGAGLSAGASSGLSPLPLFFVYSMYSILASAMQMWAMSTSFFFTLYRITEIGDGILAITVIREVMRSGFEEKHSPTRWLNIL